MPITNKSVVQALRAGPAAGRFRQLSQLPADGEAIFGMRSFAKVLRKRMLKVVCRIG
jgi:hypothetical protein